MDLYFCTLQPVQQFNYIWTVPPQQSHHHTHKQATLSEPSTLIVTASAGSWFVRMVRRSKCARCQYLQQTGTASSTHASCRTRSIKNTGWFDVHVDHDSWRRWHRAMSIENKLGSIGWITWIITFEDGSSKLHLKKQVSQHYSLHSFIHYVA